MLALIYILCAGTAAMCAGLLYRGYRRNRASLLFWSALCFLGLTADNLLLFIDRVLLPAVDLTLWRRAAALLAIVLLLYGMICKPKPSHD